MAAWILIQFLTGAAAFGAQRYPAFGVVLKIQPPRTIVVSCAEIPHFMAAMEMTFAVADPAALATLRQGMMIDFTLVADSDAPSAEHIRMHHYLNPDAEPLAVKRMELLGKAERIKTIEIYWPAGKTTQILKNVPMDEFIEIEESKPQYSKRELPSYRLGVKKMPPNLRASQ